MIFSENLAMLRHNLNITQDELANFLKVSRSTIAGYETRNREPEYHLLVKIADFFHVSTDYLLGHRVSSQAETHPVADDTKTSLVVESKSPKNQKLLEELLQEASNLSERDLILLTTLANEMQNN